jgi:hypothetical protein
MTGPPRRDYRAEASAEDGPGRLDVDRGVARYEGAREPHAVRHVRYHEFVALLSRGAGDLDGFRAAVDTLLAQMGDVAAHPVLIDLRRAAIPPLAEADLARALEHLRRRGPGVANKLAVITDPADRGRTDRDDAVEAVAAHMLRHVRSFRDDAAALDWLAAAED